MSLVWAKSDSYDPLKSAVSTWAYTIARNKKLTSLEKIKEMLQKMKISESFCMKTTIKTQ